MDVNHTKYFRKCSKILTKFAHINTLGSSHSKSGQEIFDEIPAFCRINLNVLEISKFFPNILEITRITSRGFPNTPAHVLESSKISKLSK